MMTREIIVTNTDNLKAAIDNAKKGDVIRIKSGDYERININQRQEISLEAYDIDAKPTISRINMSESKHITLSNLVINHSGFDIHDADIGISIRYSSELLLSNLEVKNADDAILVRHGSDVTITNSYLHDIKRDGIIMVSTKSIDIHHNTITNFHPNYEQYDYDDWYFNAIGTAFLPKEEGEDGIPTDHADFIQLADSEDIRISHNILDVADGAWTQSIFIHNEPNDDPHDGHHKNTDEDHHNAPVIIHDNIIRNGHQIGIKVVAQSNVELSNNQLIQTDSLGIKNTPEHMPQITISEYDHNDVWIIREGERELINSKNNGRIVPPNESSEVITEVLEADDGLMPNYFLLDIGTARASDSTVYYETKNGTAIAGEDYIATSGTAIILAGETHIAIAVDIIGDSEYEENETFFLVISNPQGEINFPSNTTEISAVHTIINDDDESSLRLLGAVESEKQLNDVF
jgi:hypothetical protein